MQRRSARARDVAGRSYTWVQLKAFQRRNRKGHLYDSGRRDVIGPNTGHKMTGSSQASSVAINRTGCNDV